MYSALLSLMVSVSRPGLLMPDLDVESLCAIVFRFMPFNPLRHGQAARAGLPRPAACSATWRAAIAACARRPVSAVPGLYLCPERRLATLCQRALPAPGL